MLQQYRVVVCPVKCSQNVYDYYNLLAWSLVPVEGKSSVCVISMKYRIMILVIIIISLGQILHYYRILQTRHVRIHTRAHPPPSPFRLSLFDAPNHGRVNALFSPVPLAINGRSLLHSNKQTRYSQ